ncbi:MAG: class I SAM-dependent methyltransferase [Bacteroidota bacterium]
MELTEDELQELEKQLSCPDGTFGIEVADAMNETNIGMTENTIHFLGLKNQHHVLELGHGNCGHLTRLLSIANEIRYYGLEVSETMWNVASHSHSHLNAVFKLYDGASIPYPDNFFDRVMGVNTIYFWLKPEELLNEIHRVLKPGGICVISYAEKAFMEELPFVQERFKLYDEHVITQLISATPLKLVELKSIDEEIQTKTGEPMKRHYSMARVKKHS